MDFLKKMATEQLENARKLLRRWNASTPSDCSGVSPEWSVADFFDAPCVISQRRSEQPAAR